MWISEAGYRQLQHYLSEAIHGTSKYKLKSNQQAYQRPQLQHAIDVLRTHMKPASTVEQFYHGDTTLPNGVYRREGFMSLAPHTRNGQEAAAAYVENDGTLYTVRVEPEVPRLRMAGDEVLIHDGMLYTHRGNVITVSTPYQGNRMNYTWLGNVYAKNKNKNKNNTRNTRNTRNSNKNKNSKQSAILNMIWCCLQQESQNGTFDFDPCDEDELEAFRAKSYAARQRLVAPLLQGYPFMEELIEEVRVNTQTTDAEVRAVLKGPLGPTLKVL